MRPAMGQRQCSLGSVRTTQAPVPGVAVDLKRPGEPLQGLLAMVPAATGGIGVHHPRGVRAAPGQVVTGKRYDGGTLDIGASRQTGFHSGHLEEGHPHRSGMTGVGDGQRLWRLEFESDGDFDVQSFARVPGGFVTALHDTTPALEGAENTYYVPFFNPGSNRSVRSVFRIVNPNDRAVDMTIDAVDALAEPGEESITLTVEADAAVQLYADELEAGDTDKFEGALGDGTGKWRLTIAATLPIDVVSLLAARSGHITNVSR